MAQENDVWMQVIAKSLAALCLKQTEKEEPARFKGVLDKVKFLEGLGLPASAAAEAAGSSAASVNELRRLAKKKKGSGTNGAKKKSKR